MYGVHLGTDEVYRVPPLLEPRVQYNEGSEVMAQSSPTAPFEAVKSCYIAESPQQARELGSQHPDLYFLLDDGQFYRGQTLGGGRKKSSGPLALKREARELGRKLKEREGELELKVYDLDRINGEIVQLEAELERLRGLQQAREKDALALDHEMQIGRAHV